MLFRATRKRYFERTLMDIVLRERRIRGLGVREKEEALQFSESLTFPLPTLHLNRH